MGSPALGAAVRVISVGNRTGDEGGVSSGSGLGGTTVAVAGHSGPVRSTGVLHGVHQHLGRTDQTGGLGVDRKVIAGLARSEGHTVLELAFGWLLSHGAVASVIAGATKPEQITANVAAGKWQPSANLHAPAAI